MDNTPQGQTITRLPAGVRIAPEELQRINAGVVGVQPKEWNEIRRTAAEEQARRSRIEAIAAMTLQTLISTGLVDTEEAPRIAVKIARGLVEELEAQT